VGLGLQGHPGLAADDVDVVEDLLEVVGVAAVPDPAAVVDLEAFEDDEVLESPVGGSVARERRRPVIHGSIPLEVSTRPDALAVFGHPAVAALEHLPLTSSWLTVPRLATA
jgi:hypothetical protein